MCFFFFVSCRCFSAFTFVSTPRINCFTTEYPVAPGPVFFLIASQIRPAGGGVLCTRLACYRTRYRTDLCCYCFVPYERYQKGCATSTTMAASAYVCIICVQSAAAAAAVRYVHLPPEVVLHTNSSRTYCPHFL